MADTHETIADIVVEMRGARTEFPFVYLMGEPDTPEVIDPKTNKIIEPRKINIRRVTVKELADRFDAAHRRERGDCAKLREALDLVDEGFTEGCLDAPGDCPTKHDLHRVSVIREKVRSALAAPPRNCDAMDWRTAWKIWREKFHPETPVGYSAVVKGTEAFMDWFTDSATEQEGCAK